MRGTAANVDQRAVLNAAYAAWVDFLKTYDRFMRGLKTPASLQKNFPQGLKPGSLFATLWHG
jgi:hypothetical protein